jgi:threonyl-tRNA synthetase
VNEEQMDFAQQVLTQLLQAGIRAQVDTTRERLGKMIRNAEVEKIPVMAVVGAKEVEAQGLSVRTRIAGDIGMLSIKEVLGHLQEAIANHTNF